MANDTHLLGRWADFSAGHWGSAGAETRQAGAWGGKNLILTRDGSLAPCSASRPIRFADMPLGEIVGAHWAWGVDGKVYFVQIDDGDVSQAHIRRFTPPARPESSTVSVETIGDPIITPVRKPGWCDLSGTVLLTSYADKTWQIDVGAPSYAVLTGTFGDAPGGRDIATFGERLLIGGIADARFATQGQRIVYSAPVDITSWPDTNFFDVGADDTEIAGMYVLLDVLTVILRDQQWWTFRGVPGGVSTLRRVHGFRGESNAITTFTHDEAAIDPSQARIHAFDHTRRGPVRFNGSAVMPIPGFGISTTERTSALNPDGIVVAHGGLDEFVMDFVPVTRTAGLGASGEANELVRVNGAFAVVEQDVLRGPAAA